ncbi:hypothetical protein D3C87_637220 [compost metagenome]
MWTICIVGYGVFFGIYSYILGHNNTTWRPWKNYLVSAVVSALVLGLIILLVYGIHSR